MTQVRIEGLVKRFGSVLALDRVDLEVQSGEFFTLLGPSGCGKTTLLRIVGGFTSPDAGSIYFDRKRIDGTPAHRRNIGMVFQNYAIFPHLNVFDNIAYGLRARHMGPTDIRRRVAAAIEMVCLHGLEKRMPRQLSGGQQQRVVLARTLVIEPRVLLMDEPLSNLDAKLRVVMRSEIRALQRAVGITTLYVTHDREEALTISDRVAVMRDGRIEQVGRPWEVYRSPRDEFVAGFVGPVSLVEGELCAFDARDGTARVRVGADAVWAVARPQPLPIGPVTLGLRPECVELIPDVADWAGDNVARGIVEQVTYAGSTVQYRVRTEAGLALVAEKHNPELGDLLQEGARVCLRVQPDRILVLPGGRG